jgi:predicted aminopeptidase
MLTDFARRSACNSPAPRPRTLGRAARIGAAALVLATLAGCASTRYLMQAGVGEWHVLRDRRSIVDVIDDPRTSETLVRQLGEVREARRFAWQKLGLPDNDSYKSYVNVGRRYVVWNVVAAPEFSVRPKEWCYPIAGCVPYHGFFHHSAARAYARRLKHQGYDVIIEGVPAYSTLGWLPDPVMSTMMRYGTDELVAMIFHELAHELLYIPNDSSFDEAFAMTVENTGLQRWLAYRHELGRFAEFERLDAADIRFARLLRHTRERLALLYASAIPRTRMLQEKKQVFARLARHIVRLERTLQVRAPVYNRWIRAGLNNADLASVGTYYNCLPGFERLLAREDGNLPRFYAAARRLAREPQAERNRQLCRSPHSMSTAIENTASNRKAS